jgi:hypothetical protein
VTQQQTEPANLPDQQDCETPMVSIGHQEVQRRRAVRFPANNSALIPRFESKPHRIPQNLFRTGYGRCSLAHS